MERSKIGSVGWLGLAASVVIFDVLAEETLSSAFSRGTENPRSRPFVIGALGITALHLMDALGPLDPIDGLVKGVRRVVK